MQATNSPMMRARSERVNVTVLGSAEASIRCPRVDCVGLEFHNSDPIDVVGRLLAEAGIGGPEELRALVDVPAGRLSCRPDPAPRPLSVRRSARDLPLVVRHMVILGLSTPYRYDPARPLLLTRASLTRRLELFDTTGFYV